MIGSRWLWWGSGPARGLSPPGPVRLLVDRGSSGKEALQVRGYRSEGTGEAEPESLLDDKA